MQTVSCSSWSQHQTSTKQLYDVPAQNPGHECKRLTECVSELSAQGLDPDPDRYPARRTVFPSGETAVGALWWVRSAPPSPEDYALTVSEQPVRPRVRQSSRCRAQHRPIVWQ